MEFFKDKIAHLINHTFQTVLVTYILLLLLEQLFTGFVSTYLNLNYLLIIVMITGILSMFSEKEKEDKQCTSWKDYVYIIILAIAGFIILKFKTTSFGWLSWLISIIAGVLIAFLSILILKNNEEKEFHWTRKNQLIIVGATLLTITAITILLSFFMSLLEAARIVFGSVYSLFIPGFIVTFILFKKIEALERIALSFALSIAVVPLIVFYFNLIGIKITALNVFLIILGIIIIALITLILLRKNNK